MPDLSAYRFTKTHEWVLREGASATIGISDHAQEELGDVIFVELPEVGQALAAGQKFGVIESVKAASDLYAPVGGTVSAVNDRLSSAPETVNGDPYGEGWMIRLDSVADGDVELLDESAYNALAGG
jgi:glycine cleavage system H protein